MIYFLVKGKKNNKISSLALSGSILGLAILTRPIAQYFILPVILIYFLIANETLLSKTKSVLIIFISCIIVVSPGYIETTLNLGMQKLVVQRIVTY
jgi:4-amino-4-deoxy-L-arabinose transferase-like glycosyltransferase